MAPSTAAVLVAFHWQLDLRQTLHALIQAVGHVVLVDNAAPDASGAPERTAQFAGIAVTVLRAQNIGGLAGAYNRALAHLEAHAPAVQQIVFLDEDSDPGELARFIDDPTVSELLQAAGTAAVAPAYRDRATGLRGKYIELSRFRLHYLSRSFTDLRRVAFVINSMSVWRIDALRRIGAFDEALGIDHVDTDYCLRARALGLAVYVHGGHVFDHAIGARKRFRLFGHEMQAGGHSAARRFLIARNTVWLARRWCGREPAFAFLCLSRLAYEAVGIVMAEDKRAGKLLALLKGTVAGLSMRRARQCRTGA